MKHIYLFILTLVLFTACAQKVSVPDQSQAATDTLHIYPDYVDVTIPANIAPLNFMVNNGGERFACKMEAADGKYITAGALEDGKLCFDTTEWRNIVSLNRGKTLKTTVYAEQGGTWVHYPPFNTYVAEEDIDRYLSYRLIEPSYEIYRQLGLYQRDLQNFDEYVIYENNRNYDDDNNHCVNCHNYQNYDTDRMLFHVRAQHGGTVFYDHGKLKKMNMRVDSVLSNCVYPSWHPTRNWVVFSSNLTGQAFHIINKNKIEVLDYGSDLVFYDADKGTLTNILKTDTDMETFPCWAPDGKKIYYCVAAFKPFVGTPDSLRSDSVLMNYDKVHYNIMSMTFDEATRTFGEPQMEVNCEAMGMSATVPRVSPDGNYLLFTLGSFGQFHIWHHDSDLWVKDLRSGDIYPLEEANSESVESYHTWSSNGRWIVCSSRREDNNFTRPAIAYFDKEGKARKAFILPQEDPEYHLLFFKSYNVPELTRSRVKPTPEELKNVIYDDEHVTKAEYKK